MIALVATGLALFTIFLWHEQRAPEPVLPLRIVRDRVMRMCLGVNFTSGMLLWCGIFFVPLFVQEVRGVTPTNAGFVLMPLMLSTALGTLVSGRRVERTGRYRVWPLSGSIVMLVGMGLLATVGIDTSVLAVAAFALVLGTGIGFAMQPSLLAAQNSAPQRDLGTATSTALLFRSLGNTVGIPILGGILNSGLTEGRGPEAFAEALPNVFLAAVPIAVVATVMALRLPARALREHVEVREPAPVGARTRSRQD
jgi:MFS family permease